MQRGCPAPALLQGIRPPCSGAFAYFSPSHPYKGVRLPCSGEGVPPPVTSAPSCLYGALQILKWPTYTCTQAKPLDLINHRPCTWFPSPPLVVLVGVNAVSTPHTTP